MEKVNMNGVVDTLGDALKLAANLTDKADRKAAADNSNNTISTPNQTVQIQLASDNSKKESEQSAIRKPQKPVIIVKKDFPENRPLTPEECSLALEREKMANAYKIQEFEYRKLMDEITRRDRLAKEERDRKDKEEREKKAEKWRKIKTVIACVAGVLGAGAVGYSMYLDSKTTVNSAPIHTEATVK